MPAEDDPDPHSHWCDQCYAYWKHKDADQPECEGWGLKRDDLECPEHRP